MSKSSSAVRIVSARADLNYFYYHLREIAAVNQTLVLLFWDEQVGMPTSNGTSRAKQRCFLTRLLHKLYCEPKFVATVEELYQTQDSLTFDDRVNVFHARREMHKHTARSTSFLERKTQATTTCFYSWLEAKRTNTIGDSLQALRGLLEVLRDEAQLLAPGDDPYDTFLEQFEWEGKLADIQPLLEDTCSKLRLFIADIPRARAVFTTRAQQALAMPLQQQRNITAAVLRKLGWDESCSRLGESAHPFSAVLGSSDYRITTRYDEKNLLAGLLMAIHEFGHLSYNAGRSKEWYGTPRGEPASFAIHESQSRFWENRIARSRSFSYLLHQTILEEAPAVADTITPDDIWSAANAFDRGHIRIEADEITYHFHILLRLRLESQLMRNQLSTSELPDAWIAETGVELGRVPSCLREGYLQDFHWFYGLFGYFPLYSLGSIYASQLAEALDSHLGAQGNSIDQCITKADFTPIKSWLHDKVWRWGASYSSYSLIQKATGSAPSNEAFLKRMRHKFSEAAHS